MRRLIKRITTKHAQAHFYYEAGPTGYGLHRLIVSMWFPCSVVAPSLIPRKPGDRVKTNRRDAVACQSASKFGSDSLLMKFGRRLALVSSRNQRHAPKLAPLGFCAGRFPR